MATLSAFNPHDMSEATVRTISTGRSQDLDKIITTVRGNLKAGTISHLIVSAPRGYGKSFLMRLVQLELTRLAREEDLPVAVVLMPEEMPHVREPETLLNEIVRTLNGGAGSAASLTWGEDDGALWDKAEEDLRRAIDNHPNARNGLIVALIENFDEIIRRAFSKEVQSSRLRRLLTEPQNRLMLISASSSGAFDSDYDKPLFRAFEEVRLAPWTLEECLAFFDRQRCDAGKPPLDPIAKARARAVALFIGGTPRLATLLGDALFDDDVLYAADVLHKLVDELTPYYRDRVEALPGRSQKLLDALLRGGEPATQSELARRVNAPGQRAIAGPFQDLINERIVVGEKAVGSAEVLYRAADRVFAHFYRRRIVQHGTDVCPLEALVDLLANFFSPDEKRAKISEFAGRDLIAEARVMAKLYDVDRGTSPAERRWILVDLASQYIPRRLLPLASHKIREALLATAEHVERIAVDDAYATLHAALNTNADYRDRALLFLARSMIDAHCGLEGGLKAAELAAAEAGKMGDVAIVFTAELGRIWSLGQLERYDEALTAALDLARKAEVKGKSPVQAIALRYVGDFLNALGRLQESIAPTQQAAALAKREGDKREEVLALKLATVTLSALDRHEEVVATAHQAAASAELTGEKGEQAFFLRYAAFSLGALGRHEEVVTIAQRAAALAELTGEKGEQAIALRCAVFSLAALGNHKKAVATAFHAAVLAELSGEKREQAILLRYAAFSLGPLGRHEEAASAAQRAAVLADSAGDNAEQADSMRLAALALSRIGRSAEAIGALFKATCLATTINDTNEIDLLVKAASSIGRRCVSTDPPLDLYGLHEMLGGAARLFEPQVDSRIGTAWIAGFVGRALQSMSDPTQLKDWASAIDLHIVVRSRAYTDQLRAAARFHAARHNPAVLVRLDPDFVKSLEAMFSEPRPDGPTGKKKRSQRANRPANWIDRRMHQFVGK